MLTKKLLIGSLCLMSMASYAQETKSFETKISEKEMALEKSITSSRQVNTTLKAELKDLYVAYKNELEEKLNTATDAKILSETREKIRVLSEKIENYSIQK